MKINIDAKISPAILAIKSNGSESLVGVKDCRISAKIATKISEGLGGQLGISASTGMKSDTGA
ncbi:hypothetical protein DSECCO2_645210 [anaerobic digester metagenome]